MTLRLVPKDETVPVKVVVPVHEGEDFGDKLARIRASLDKINRLMAELRSMSANSASGTARSPEDRAP